MSDAAFLEAPGSAGVLPAGAWVRGPAVPLREPRPRSRDRRRPLASPGPHPRPWIGPHEMPLRWKKFALAILPACRYDPRDGPSALGTASGPGSRRESMNPLDSIWGTIISGVVLALILVAIF